EALGKSSVVPSIDFDTEGVVDIPVLNRNTEFRIPEIQINHSFNPFDEKTGQGREHNYHSKQTNTDGWEQLYAGFERQPAGEDNIPAALFDDEAERPAVVQAEYLQLKNKYIITAVKSGLMIIDQKRAHERILYEHFI